jgi:hypothetical protein
VSPATGCSSSAQQRSASDLAPLPAPVSSSSPRGRRPCSAQGSTTRRAKAPRGHSGRTPARTLHCGHGPCLIVLRRRVFDVDTAVAFESHVEAGERCAGGIRVPSPRMQPSLTTAPASMMAFFADDDVAGQLGAVQQQRARRDLRQLVTVASWERTTAPVGQDHPAPVQAVPRVSAESAIWAAGTSGQAWLKLNRRLQPHHALIRWKSFPAPWLGARFDATVMKKSRRERCLCHRSVLDDARRIIAARPPLG